MTCFTHGPDQNSVPVCKNPTFTHDKLAPCARRPILLTALTKLAFPCGKTPLLLTANWLRV